MAYWVYKCNSRNRVGQYYGDWQNVFDRAPDPVRWGCLDKLRGPKELKKGDTVLADQSGRKELVGIVSLCVRQWRLLTFALRDLQRTRRCARLSSATQSTAHGVTTRGSDTTW